MTQSSKQEWVSCTALIVSDTIRWREPLWAKPNKPRGKPDKIGEQVVTAKLMALDELAELEVVDVQHLELAAGVEDAPTRIKPGEKIRRKISSIKNGNLEKLVQEV